MGSDKKPTPREYYVIVSTENKQWLVAVVTLED